MNQNATVKEALNRQFVAMIANSPLECGFAERNSGERKPSEPPSITVTTFECVYPISASEMPVSVESR